METETFTVEVLPSNIIVMDLLPEVVIAPGQELLRIAPLLRSADEQATALGQRIRTLEQDAMDTLHRKHEDLYAQKDAAFAERERLTSKARELLDLHRLATGDNGHILSGYYTLTRSEKQELKPKISNGHLLGWLLLNAVHLLRQVVVIDFEILHELITHRGELLPVFKSMPVVIETTVTQGSRIEWKHLPVPEPITPSVAVVEAPADGSSSETGT